MATYVGLGSRQATGTVDTTGLNPGNWTVAFDAAVLAINIPYFEIYKMIVTGAPGSTFTVWVDNRRWDIAQRGDLNSWDPQQPLQLQPGLAVYFMYSDPTSDNTPPTVTIWLRYDQDIEANRKVMQ